MFFSYATSKVRPSLVIYKANNFQIFITRKTDFQEPLSKQTQDERIEGFCFLGLKDQIKGFVSFKILQQLHFVSKQAHS